MFSAQQNETTNNFLWRNFATKRGFFIYFKHFGRVVMFNKDSFLIKYFSFKSAYWKTSRAGNTQIAEKTRIRIFNFRLKFFFLS